MLDVDVPPTRRQRSRRSRLAARLRAARPAAPAERRDATVEQLVDDDDAWRLEPVDPVEWAGRTESTDPVASPRSVETAEPVESADAVAATKPVAAAEPVESPEPVEPVASSDDLAHDQFGHDDLGYDDLAHDQFGHDDLGHDDLGHDEPTPASEGDAEGPGPRARRQRQLRRAQRRERLSSVAGALLVIAVLAAAAFVGPRVWDTVGGWFAADEVAATAPSDDGAATALDASGRRTVLVATFDERTGQRVTGVQLLSLDDEGRAAVVLVPASVVTDVPGAGLIPLADAGSIGGAPLLELTLENTLDVRIDAAVTMTRSSWSALFGRTGGFEVMVREAIDTKDDDGTNRRLFEPGSQFLDGPRLGELLTVDVSGQSELAAMSRTQHVVEGFLGALAADPDTVFEDGAPMLQTDDTAVVEDVLRALATAEADDRLDVLTMPVDPVGAGEQVIYQISERGHALAGEVLGAGTAATDGTGERVRLEVLNGNGRVGVGAEVAELLVPLGFAIPITGNAETFDVSETIVTVRDDDPAVLAAAREIVDTLGVGRVSLSTVPSTIVDITVVVGADWRAPSP